MQQDHKIVAHGRNNCLQPLNVAYPMHWIQENQGKLWKVLMLILLSQVLKA